MYKHNNKYKISIPDEIYEGVTFKGHESVLTYKDKTLTEVLLRLTPYQREKLCLEDYHVWEDVLGCLAVCKIKNNYIVELVEEF